MVKSMGRKRFGGNRARQCAAQNLVIDGCWRYSRAMSGTDKNSSHAIFTDDPATARDRFLRAAATVGMPVRAFKSQTANDPPLTCDVGRLGSPDAPTAIVVASNAPGMAGYVGAGACTAILHDRLQHYLHARTSLVLIHAVNPAGSVWPPQSLHPPKRGWAGLPVNAGPAGKAPAACCRWRRERRPLPRA